MAPFILQNFKKNSWADLELFAMNKIFLIQTIIITFIYLLALFIVQNLKNFLQQIKSYEDAPFLGPKFFSSGTRVMRCAIFGSNMAHFPKWIFFFQKTW